MWPRALTRSVVSKPCVPGTPPGMGAHQTEHRLLQKEGRTSNKWGTFRPSDGDEKCERNQAGGSRVARGQVRGCPLDAA